MVMHARKTQRMNDGYFEKHQTHPYQNSKYSSSKSYGSTSDRYIRDSPNGNYRSDSPDSQSPRDRDRSYQSKAYLQKIREKERENRDYKVSRDKYSECVRSPKDKRSRESEHRTNNDRNDEKSILHPIKSQNMSSRDRKPMHNNSVDKRDDRERVPRVGDWTEHVSSSGKKYYYNCKTEVSQWEKPREWIERMDRDRFRARERDRDRDRDADRCYSSSSSSRSSSMRHDKHSSSRASNSSSIKDVSRDRESATSSSRHWSSSATRDESDNALKDSRSTIRKHMEENQAQATQDMEISPGGSTPTSEISYSNNTIQQQPEQNMTGPVLLAVALPKVMSHPQLMPSTPGGKSDSSPQSTSVVMPVVTSITSSNAPGPPNILPTLPTLPTLPRIMSQTATPVEGMDKGIHGSVVLGRQGAEPGNSAVHTSLSVDTNHSGPGVEGPPTPTHSETPDCSKVAMVPLSSPPVSSVSQLQGMASSLQALRAPCPTITPSLANHYREDLIAHVKGWPAEVVEKQANKLAEERCLMTAIQCSKISSELKAARAMVRLTEIQATLQEQRIKSAKFICTVIGLDWLKFCLLNNVKCDPSCELLRELQRIRHNGVIDSRILFLRQQIKELEELKSQNSFMSDDS